MLNRRSLLGMGLAALASARVRAQGAYPDRPIKLIVPRPAGGVVDVIAREWSAKAGKSLGSIYVENMGGGGGTIGAAAAARAPADGYTLLLGTTSELVISPLLAPQAYDPLGFEPVAMICDSAAVIVAHPSLPVANLKELVAYVRQNKDRANYGSAGAGTVSNLAGELLKHLANLPELVHVPYRGGGPLFSDAIGGQIPISTPMMSQQVFELHQQGKLKIVAVAAESRLGSMPDIPTAREQGYPDLVARLFFGIFAPARTPKDIVVKIEQATRAALQDPELRKSFEASGFQTLATTDAATTAAYVAGEVKRWRPVLAQFKPQ